MKRGNISSRESKTRKTPIIIRVRLGDAEPEPMRVVAPQMIPLVGQTFFAVPAHLHTHLFKKHLEVLNIADEDGIEVFCCKAVL